MKYNSKDLKEMSNAVRAAALDAVLSAHSGHIGIVLGAADVVTTVFANFLHPARDRFILSAGHGSALLYAVLKLAGYNIGDLKSFRKMGGLPGHPEYGIDGVGATTGPLGQGVGNAVGVALAEKIKHSDGRVYCLCSDGDLMEGVAQESIAFAGRYGLNNLVLMWDDNGISIDGTALTDVDIPSRMVAAGWKVISINGNDFNRINAALMGLGRSRKPVFIQCRTVIGHGSSVAGTPRAHGYGLSDDELVECVRAMQSPRGVELWREHARADASRTATGMLSVDVPRIAFGGAMSDISTRELSGKYLEKILPHVPNLIGGSADLGASTNAKTSVSRDILPPRFDGNYINYGVREHAMGAIMNGMATMGLRPYGATFLVFSDYLRPSIRLSALSGLPVIYVFTHDSIAVGEDGPTHQPIEQLPSLRLIPNLNVFRPCNGEEVAAAWNTALRDTSRPSCMILSRQKISIVPAPRGADIEKGAYVIVPSSSRRVRATIVATGAEVPLAIDVARRIGRGVQVVSMPCVEQFRNAPADYKKSILRGYVVAIEAAASASWFEFADAVVGIDEFGASGNGAAVYKHFGFDADVIARDIARRIK